LHGHQKSGSWVSRDQNPGRRADAGNP